MLEAERKGRLVMGLVENWSREQVKIPRGNVAVVSRKKAHDGSIHAIDIQLGKVTRYKNKSELNAGIKNNEVGRCLSVYKDKENKEWVGIKNLQEDKFIELGLWKLSQEKIYMTLFGPRHGDNLREIERDAEVDKSFFTDLGFDLDVNNINNAGAILSEPISQFLYEFQAGIGRFAPPEEQIYYPNWKAW
jgi:hypothetical protein